TPGWGAQPQSNKAWSISRQIAFRCSNSPTLCFSTTTHTLAIFRPRRWLDSTSALPLRVEVAFSMPGHKSKLNLISPPLGLLWGYAWFDFSFGLLPEVEVAYPTVPAQAGAPHQFVCCDQA